MDLIREREEQIAAKEEEYRRQANDVFGDALLPALREGKLQRSTVEDVVRYLRENVRAKGELELLELEGFLFRHDSEPVSSRPPVPEDSPPDILSEAEVERSPAEA